MRRPGFQSQLCQRLAMVWGDPPSRGLGSLMGQRQTGSPTTSDSSRQSLSPGAAVPRSPAHMVSAPPATLQGGHRCPQLDSGGNRPKSRSPPKATRPRSWHLGMTPILQAPGPGSVQENTSPAHR